MFTRQDYLNSNESNDEQAAAHRKYYAQFVNDRTISTVVHWVGAATLKASTDPHLNDIPLARWDAMVNNLPLAIRPETVGDYYTLGGGVCIAKEAARQWLEAQASTKSPD